MNYGFRGVFPSLKRLFMEEEWEEEREGKRWMKRTKKNPRFFHVRANEKIMKFFLKKLI